MPSLSVGVLHQQKDLANYQAVSQKDQQPAEQSLYLAEVGAIPRLQLDVPHESPLHRTAYQEKDLCPYMNIDVKTAEKWWRFCRRASQKKSHPSVSTAVQPR